MNEKRLRQSLISSRYAQMNGFRSLKWDPLLIIYQIISIQAVFYLGLGFWFTFINGTLGKTTLIEHLFSNEVKQEKIK